MHHGFAHLGLHELPYGFRRYKSVGLSKLMVDGGFVVEHEEALTTGLSAVAMIVESEINNYIANVLPDRKQGRAEMAWFRSKLHAGSYLLRMLKFVWRRTVNFERGYIDNLLIARKGEDDA